MEHSPRVMVVSASPIFTRALAEWLEDGPLRCRVQAIHGAELAEPTGTAALDLALVAPQSWQELHEWLQPLRTNLAHIPWLLLADPRLAGMFLSCLEERPCALVAPLATATELWSSISGLAAGRYECLTADLLSAFSHSACTFTRGMRTRQPSPPELQCACAVSLGLPNHRIAEILHIAEATVKSHLYRLMRKLDLENRHELGDLVYQALALLPATYSRQ